MNFTDFVVWCAFILQNFTNATNYNCYFRVLECKKTAPGSSSQQAYTARTDFIIETREVAEGKGELQLGKKQRLLVDAESVGAAKKLKELIDSKDTDTSFELFVRPTSTIDLNLDNIPQLKVNLSETSMATAKPGGFFGSKSKQVLPEKWMHAKKVWVKLNKYTNRKQPMHDGRYFNIQLEGASLDFRYFVFGSRGNGNQGSGNTGPFTPHVRGVGQMLDLLQRENSNSENIVDGNYRFQILGGELISGNKPLQEMNTLYLSWGVQVIFWNIPEFMTDPNAASVKKKVEVSRQHSYFESNWDNFTKIITFPGCEAKFIEAEKKTFYATTSFGIMPSSTPDYELTTVTPFGKVVAPKNFENRCHFKIIECNKIRPDKKKLPDATQPGIIITSEVAIEGRGILKEINGFFTLMLDNADVGISAEAFEVLAESKGNKKMDKKKGTDRVKSFELFVLVSKTLGSEVPPFTTLQNQRSPNNEISTSSITPSANSSKSGSPLQFDVWMQAVTVGLSPSGDAVHGKRNFVMEFEVASIEFRHFIFGGFINSISGSLDVRQLRTEVKGVAQIVFHGNGSHRFIPLGADLIGEHTMGQQTNLIFITTKGISLTIKGLRSVCPFPDFFKDIIIDPYGKGKKPAAQSQNCAPITDRSDVSAYELGSGVQNKWVIVTDKKHFDEDTHILTFQQLIPFDEIYVETNPEGKPSN